MSKWWSQDMNLWAWARRTTRLGLSYLTCEMGILFTLWMCYSQPKPIKHFDPWVVEIPGGGYGDSLQYSCLENSMDRGVWRATVHGVAKSQTWLSTSFRLKQIYFLFSSVKSVLGCMCVCVWITIFLMVWLPSVWFHSLNKNFYEKYLRSGRE